MNEKQRKKQLEIERKEERKRLREGKAKLKAKGKKQSKIKIEYVIFTLFISLNLKSILNLMKNLNLAAGGEEICYTIMYLNHYKMYLLW